MGTAECWAVGHESLSISLVSSPGYGVIDSGCGRTSQTLEQVETLIASKGPWKIETYEAEKAFRFGSGMVETLDWPSIWRDRCSRGSRFSTAPFAASYLGEASHESRFQAIYNGNS